MVDIFSALAKRRRDLIEQKEFVFKEYQEKTQPIDQELSVINLAIKTMNNAVKNYLCQDCNGTGNVSRCDAAGDMEDVTCPTCRGTGVKLWQASM